MNYVGIRRGQHMPVTGIAQKLLNRHGAGLTVDGAFGRRTWLAVRDFQRLNGLGIDGVIGRKTWPRLVDGLPIHVGDSIDIWERGDDHVAVEAHTLRADGIRFYGAQPVSAYFSQALTGLIDFYRGANLSLLRFHGHGRPGSMNVIGGNDGHEDYSSLNAWVFRASNIVQAMRRFGWVLGPMGSISLNGCRVGAGAEGRRMITEMAQLTGYPVVAGIQTQYGGNSSTFYMEGPVAVGLPSPGMTLRDWCDGLPDFPEKLTSGSGGVPPIRRLMESRPAF